MPPLFRFKLRIIIRCWSTDWPNRCEMKDRAEMYVGEDVSPDFYAWVFPKCDHVAVGTGTVVDKKAWGRDGGEITWSEGQKHHCSFGRWSSQVPCSTSMMIPVSD